MGLRTWLKERKFEGKRWEIVDKSGFTAANLPNGRYASCFGLKNPTPFSCLLSLPHSGDHTLSSSSLLITSIRKPLCSSGILLFRAVFLDISSLFLKYKSKSAHFSLKNQSNSHFSLQNTQISNLTLIKSILLVCMSLQQFLQLLPCYIYR